MPHSQSLPFPLHVILILLHKVTLPNLRMTIVLVCASAAFCLFLCISTLLVPPTEAQDGQPHLDRFTYGETTVRDDGFVDYTPAEWYFIDCPEGVVEGCEAYIDKWRTGRGWNLTRNQCIHCPATPQGNFACGRHHESPIELLREYGLEPGTHPNAKECIDLHWMKYEDSFCTMDQLEDANAFTIERHALRISQPIEVYANVADDTDGIPDGVRLKCRKPGRGSRFGRIDFSKGRFRHRVSLLGCFVVWRADNGILLVRIGTRSLLLQA